MLAAAIVAEVTQIVVPELLFTGGAVTIITVGFFFSLENPVAVLRQKVMTDALTGVKSRHSYEADIVRMDRQFAAGTEFGMVFCDINDLKAVNDNFGHLEGDVYIGNVAQVLMACMRNAEQLYRMGGDEFLAVYRNKSAELIHSEIEAVTKACGEMSLSHAYPVGVAMGCAISDRGFADLRDVLRVADFQMYSAKTTIKQQRAYLLDNSEQLDINGLTDRIFDAFASTDPTRFLFVCNMATNVSRLSRTAVEYFGFRSEFIYDFNSYWLGRIHPDDRNAFYDDIMAVFSGKQQYHNVQYRVENGSGAYVLCSCHGKVLRGKGGEAELFAGTMYVENAAERIDRVTDLRMACEMMSRFEQLIRSHSPAAIMELSVTNLSRINMLYGYNNGDKALWQLAGILREVAGPEADIFRSDGNKFVICAPGLSGDGMAEIYRRICVAAEHKIQLDSFSPPLQLAAGAFMLTADFMGTGSIIRSNLIYAHSSSKYDRRGRLQFYNGGRAISESGDEHSRLLQSIHQDAIGGRKGFYLVYQPIVQVSSGRIIGAEALLRWNGSDFGEVSPKSFIPWLEGDPSFIGLGGWILRRALMDAVKAREIQSDFTVNVNVALPQLEHEDFRASVLSMLEETGFPAEHLCLELTERCRELDEGSLKSEVEFFRGHGIRIALDDLGTGFSSFGLLLSLDVDEVKLDRTFVREIQTKRVNQILTSMIIEASSSMGYTTCLEGVENDGLCEYLNSYGATYYQGFYCMEPERIEDFLPLMEKWNREREVQTRLY